MSRHCQYLHPKGSGPGPPSGPNHTPWYTGPQRKNPRSSRDSGPAWWGTTSCDASGPPRTRPRGRPACRGRGREGEQGETEVRVSQQSLSVSRMSGTNDAAMWAAEFNACGAAPAGITALWLTEQVLTKTWARSRCLTKKSSTYGETRN